MVRKVALCIFGVLMYLVIGGIPITVYAQMLAFTFPDMSNPAGLPPAKGLISPEVLKGFLPPPLAGCRREEGVDFELNKTPFVNEASIKYVDITPEARYGEVSILIQDYGEIDKTNPLLYQAFQSGQISADPNVDISKCTKINIKGYPAMVYKMSAAESGEYNYASCTVIVKARFLVYISLIGTDEWDIKKISKIMMSYANAIDYDGISRLATATKDKFPPMNIKDMKEGDRIVTKDRNVTVNLGKSSVMKVSKNSKVEVTKLSKNESSFKVILGKVWTKIKKLGKGEKINFYGVTACTGVRGTEFVFEVEKDGTTIIIVIEGMVEFSDLEKKKVVIVREKQRSIVKRGKLPSDPETIDLKKIIKWWE